MSRANERPTGWFKMSTAAYADAKILKVSSMAELLFYRMLQLAAATTSGGVLTFEQIELVGRGLRGLRGICEELADAELLSRVHESRASSTRNPEFVQDSGQDHAQLVHDTRGARAELTSRSRSTRAELTSSYRINAYRKWNQSLDEPAGQRPLSSDAGQSAHARPPARGEKERKTERPTSRPASPDGREVGSARAAPRRAPGDAARHAPADQDQNQNRWGSTPGCFSGPTVDDEPEADRVDQSQSGKAEALAFLKDRVKQFQTSNPNSRGRDAQFSRWSNGNEMRQLRDYLGGGDQ